MNPVLLCYLTFKPALKTTRHSRIRTIAVVAGCGISELMPQPRWFQSDCDCLRSRQRLDLLHLNQKILP